MYLSLKIENLAIPVLLGVPDQERKMQQVIMINLEIKLKDCLGMYTDKIEDAICYAGLSEEIYKFSCSKEFKLIEHYGYLLFELIKTLVSLVSKDNLIKLKISKSPPLTNMERASFELSDWE